MTGVNITVYPVPKGKKVKYKSIIILTNKSNLRHDILNSSKRWIKSFMVGLYIYSMALMIYGIYQSDVDIMTILRALATVIHVAIQA